MLLYLTEINENINKDILENRMSLLCSNRLHNSRAYKNAPDRIRSVAAGLLLQQGVDEMLSEIGETIPVDTNGRKNLRIGKTESGKPYLQDYPEIYFNISHSGKMVGCVFANREIGFDLQQRRECNSERLISKFHPKEQEVYFAMENLLREEWFFRLWAAKEAYVKYTGRGLSERFNSFWVDLDLQTIYDINQNCVAQCIEIPLKKAGYYATLVSDTIDELRIIIRDTL